MADAVAPCFEPDRRVAGMRPDDSDETLMLAYRAGSEPAFAELYRRYRGPLYRYCLRWLKNAAQAEEVFQDAWLRVITARERYQVEASFRTYLFQIAHRLLIDRHRRERPEQSIEDERNPVHTLPDLSTESSESWMLRTEQVERLGALVEQLPLAQREAFLLRAEGDFGPEEIARITGVPRETAKSRLRYAFARLREGLRP